MTLVGLGFRLSCHRLLLLMQTSVFQVVTLPTATEYAASTYPITDEWFVLRDVFLEKCFVLS